MPFPVPMIILALAMSLLLAAAFAFIVGRRGGRWRELPGWVGFWVFFGAVLVCLSRADPWMSFPLLALVMFFALKEYFHLAAVRPQDRWAILASYVAIPVSLYPAFMDSYGLFSALVPVGLMFLLPALLSASTRQSGLLDAMGRLLLGALVFVFGAAHLGLMAHQPRGRLELFAILVLAAELPQRIAGRFRLGAPVLRPAAGVAVALALCAAVGWWLGTPGAMTPLHGSIAGLLVAVAVTAGALVAEAVSQDLGLAASAGRMGRGAFLDRSIPALYAAPLYFHYLKYFV